MGRWETLNNPPSLVETLLCSPRLAKDQLLNNYTLELEILGGPRSYVLTTTGLVTEQEGEALVKYFAHHGITARLRKHEWGPQKDDGL